LINTPQKYSSINIDGGFVSISEGRRKELEVL
jgi:hypothetical protein